MSDLLHSMADASNNAAARHAMMVHLPIAISLLGVPLVIALLLSGGRAKALRWMTFALFVIGAVGAFAAERSGEDAYARLDTARMTEAALDTLNRHESMGEKVWLLMGAAAALSLVTAVKAKAWRWAALVLLLAVSLAGAGWTAVTAHDGGQLVYEQGVGVPTSPNNVNP